MPVPSLTRAAATSKAFRITKLLTRLADTCIVSKTLTPAANNIPKVWMYRATLIDFTR